jgi:hypothetical protein
MGLMTQPQPTATPQQLAEALQYLLRAFLFAVLVGIAHEAYHPLWPMVFDTVVIGASVLLCTALYIAARRLGFSQAKTLIAIALSLFIPILGLILVVSASIRLSRQLKTHGWRVGLFGARPA